MHTKNERVDATIAALLTEPTHAQAAAKAGISPAALRRWLRKPAFVSRYQAARRAVVDSAIGRLQQVTSEAVDALQKGLSAEKPGTKLRAAELILKFALQGVELADLVKRVDQLEARSKSKPKPLPKW